MFRRARRQLTLWYVGGSAVLLGIIVAITIVLVTGDIRAAGDLELRLRAERLAEENVADVLQGTTGERDSKRDHEDDEDHREERPESLGMLAYVIAPDTRRWVALSTETLPGLPDVQAASTATGDREGRFSDLSIAQGSLRLYTLPVLHDHAVVAIIQVARSEYFTARTSMGLITVVGGLGALGLLAAGIAGYWLAGRAMQPIAVALQRQRDFVADASHELRTPLTLLRANAEMLARHPEQPVTENIDLVQDLIGETDRLSRLVADLLTLARADSGQAHLSSEIVDLSALAQRICREVQPLAEAKGLEIGHQLEPGVLVRGDPDRLRQLGLILLENAVRYTSTGRVLLRVRADHRWGTLAVEDTGPGIAADHLPRVFERFYRVDTARGKDTGGTGLGLSIAKWIAEAHGGQISATSKIGAGSTFSVLLPRLAAWRDYSPATESTP